jgi:hypothetical protein
MAVRAGAVLPHRRRLSGPSAAGRRGWLETLTAELQRRCGAAAALTALAMPAILLAGGWHWQAAAASLTEGILATCVSLWAIAHFRRRHDHLRPLARRMSPAVHGAFLLHPPVIVGLALAVQGLPVPAEVRFVLVLAGGVTASFGLAAAARRRRRPDFAPV